MVGAFVALGVSASVFATAAPASTPASARVGWDNYRILMDGPQCKPHHRAGPSVPSWARPRRMTVLSDSVLIGGGPALRAARPCWRVKMFGRPFIGIRDAAREMGRRRVAPVAVIGLGYNSSWGPRNRRHYGFWAGKFDRDARLLLRTLRRRGARQIVWVTARQPKKRFLPRDAWGQADFAYYTAFVNERLRRLDRRRDDLVLADWNRASQRPGLTYDSIHLNPRGAKVMVRTIRRAIGDESRRQARRDAREAPAPDRAGPGSRRRVGAGSAPG